MLLVFACLIFAFFYSRFQEAVSICCSKVSFKLDFPVFIFFCGFFQLRIINNCETFQNDGSAFLQGKSLVFFCFVYLPKMSLRQVQQEGVVCLMAAEVVTKDNGHHAGPRELSRRSIHLVACQCDELNSLRLVLRSLVKLLSLLPGWLGSRNLSFICNKCEGYNVAIPIQHVNFSRDKF